MSLTPPPAPRLTPSPRLTPPPTPSDGRTAPDAADWHAAASNAPPMPQPWSPGPPDAPTWRRFSPPDPRRRLPRHQSAADLSSGVPQYARSLPRSRIADRSQWPSLLSTPALGAPPRPDRRQLAPRRSRPSSRPRRSRCRVLGRDPAVGALAERLAGAASPSQTSEDVLPVLSASSIEPIESLNHSSAEISACHRSSSSCSSMPRASYRPRRAALTTRAGGAGGPADPGTFASHAKSAWERLRTPVIGAGLFGLGSVCSGYFRR